MVIPNKTDPIPIEIAEIFPLIKYNATMAINAPKTVGKNNKKGARILL